MQNDQHLSSKLTLRVILRMDCGSIVINDLSVTASPSSLCFVLMTLTMELVSRDTTNQGKNKNSVYSRSFERKRLVRFDN